MTEEEKKQIEKIFNKSISEIEEIDIPAYIRKRDEKEMLRALFEDALEDEASHKLYFDIA